MDDVMEKFKHSFFFNFVSFTIPYQSLYRTSVSKTETNDRVHHSVLLCAYVPIQLISIIIYRYIKVVYNYRVTYNPRINENRCWLMFLELYLSNLRNILPTNYSHRTWNVKKRESFCPIFCYTYINTPIMLPS